ncbi:hypothetical protein ACP70R_028787 [Stipagrostis hirtigluma subsp. patula]
MMASKEMLQLLVLASVLAMLMANQAWGCENEKVLLFEVCKKSLTKYPSKFVHPSQECFQTVLATDMPCVCRILTPQDEETINVERLVRVARDCGRPLPVGTHCGTYVVSAPPTNAPRAPPQA